MLLRLITLWFLISNISATNVVFKYQAELTIHTVNVKFFFLKCIYKLHTTKTNSQLMVALWCYFIVVLLHCGVTSLWCYFIVVLLQDVFHLPRRVRDIQEHRKTTNRRCLTMCSVRELRSSWLVKWLWAYINVDTI